MSGHHFDELDLKKHVRAYMLVFATLWILTVVTVAVSYIEFSLFMKVTVAVLIATVKGSLVACYFMHLISEKKLIYWILMVTFLFFIGLLLIPAIGHWDQVISEVHVP